MTLKYIDVFISILGKDIFSLKVKTTRKLKVLLTEDLIQVPKELIKINRDIVMTSDILFANKIPLFLTLRRKNLIYHGTPYCEQEIQNNIHRLQWRVHILQKEGIYDYESAKRWRVCTPAVNHHIAHARRTYHEPNKHQWTCPIDIAPNKSSQGKGKMHQTKPPFQQYPKTPPHSYRICLYKNARLLTI